MKKAKELRELRAQKQQELRAMVDTATAEKRELTAEETTQFDALNDEIENLAKQVTRAEKFEATELEMAKRQGRAMTGEGDSSELDEIRKNYNLSRAMRTLQEGGKLEGFEAEMHAEGRKELQASGANFNPAGVSIPLKALRALAVPGAEQRIMSVTGGSPAGTQGGYAVPTETMGLIEFLRPYLFVSEVATIYDNLVGNVTFPRESAVASASYLTETSEVAAGTPTLDKVELTPKRLASYVPVTNQLLLQTSMSVQQQIIKMLLTAIAEKFQSVAIKGGGSNEPSGIITQLLAQAGTPQIVAIGATGGALTKAAVEALEAVVAVANGEFGRLAYATNPLVRKVAKQTKIDAGSGKFLWDVADREAPLNGYPTYVSNIIPSNLTKSSGSNLSALLYGDWSSLVLASWGGINLIQDPYTLARTGQTRMIAETFTDVDLMHLGKFGAIVDIDTTVVAS